MKKRLLLKTTIVTIVLAVVLSVISNAHAQENQLLQINLSRSSESQIEITSINSFAGRQTAVKNKEGSYTLTIYDSSNSQLYRTNFDFTSTIISESFSESGEISGTTQQTSSQSTSVLVPAFDNAARLTIQNSQGEVLTQENLEPVSNDLQEQQVQQLLNEQKATAINLPGGITITKTPTVQQAQALQAVKERNEQQSLSQLFPSQKAAINLPTGQTITASPASLTTLVAGTVIFAESLIILAIYIWRRLHNQTSFSKKTFLVLALADILVLVTLAMIFNNQKQPATPQAQANPAVVITNEERIKLLDLLPVVKKGEYIFEYEPQSQFYSLDILNPANEEQIEKEVIGIIKSASSDGNYCKFDVLVAGDPQKIKENYLPGCGNTN